MDKQILDSVSQFISKKTGFELSSPAREMSVRKAIQRVAKMSGLGDDKCLAAISRNADLFQQVVQEITVGETYFFRHPAQFDKLAAWLSELARRRKPPYRLWSVGCATGEEPYSLAMLCKELSLLAQVEIVASDINTAYLEKASGGVYTKNSFRQKMPYECQQKYFRQLDPNNWEICREIRQAVRFIPLNLMDPFYPPECSDMDLLCCRNVMYYFDPGMIQQTLAKLANTMREEGIFVVSPTETMPYLQLCPKFQRLAWDKIIVYKKVSQPFTPLADASESLEKQMAARIAAEMPIAAPAVAASAPTKPLPPIAAPTAEQADVCGKQQAIDYCRLLLGQERYLEALEYALDHFPADMDTEARYYLACAYEKLGLWQEALGEHQTILHQQPQFVLSVLSCAEIYRTLGDEKSAHASLVRLKKSLEQMPQDDEIPYSEGITAGSLLKTLR